TVAATAARTASSSRISHFNASACPPAAMTVSAAVKIVPGSLGLGTADLAAIVTLAPSRAARNAMAKPMPRDAPVMIMVFPASVVMLVVGCWLLVVGCWLLVVGCWLLVVGCWLLVVGCWLLVWVLGFGDWGLGIGGLLL